MSIFQDSGCLQLMEILEISWNLNGPPGNFCVMIENFILWLMALLHELMMWHCLCIEECNIKMLLML